MHVLQIGPCSKLYQQVGLLETAYRHPSTFKNIPTGVQEFKCEGKGNAIVLRVSLVLLVPE